MSLELIEKAVSPLGLRLRGGFHPTAADGVPGNSATLILIGNAGPEMWRAFTGGGEVPEDDPQPLDSWTRRVLSRVAEELAVQGLKARALYPFDGPPYLPFQRWAAAAEGLKQSPIGPVMHPEFGLWHAYRGALAFEKTLDLPANIWPGAGPGAHPCDGCADKPCLSACPVGAIRAGAYDINACVKHARSAAGGDCRDGGCLARRACPVAPEYAYGPAQARFHFQRFLAAHPPAVEKKGQERP